MSQKWYAVYTKPRWEKKVASGLSRRLIENYCPLNKVVRQWSDRKKVIEEPLFVSYVFVRIEENKLEELQNVEGIVNLVYWLGRPAVIREEEIDTIKRFLNDHTNIQLEKTVVSINDTVRVMSGPLMELEGKVMAVKSKTIRVFLPSLGYILTAEIDKSNVKIINTVSATGTPIQQQNR